MATYQVEHIVQVADIDGNLATTKFRSFTADTVTAAQLATGLNNFATAVQAATNGKIVSQSASILFVKAQIIPGTTPPTDAVYPTVTDGARLNFNNSAGAKLSLTIPAPTETTFLAAPQRDYVDPAGDASSLISLIKTQANDAAGNNLNLYQGGIKVGKGARRRRSPRPGL